MHTGSQEKGIVVGCNQAQEWLLPWWYMNYSIHNHYPITFVNFGDMTSQALAWCRQRGTVINLDCGDAFIARKEDVDPEVAAFWESRRAAIWTLRQAWLKIPFAMLKSPYQKSVWMDLDCQVVKSIEPIFSVYLQDCDFAVTKEADAEQIVYQAQGSLLEGEVIYNAGVVAYRQGSTVLQEWAERVRTQNMHFMGCQKVLARLLHEKKLPFTELPATYNWAMAQGKNPEAAIFHYWGVWQGLLKKHIHFLKTAMFIDLEIG